jgi:short-subunit dehydrogenase involved in D-alanine esterification of teichoic acids
MPSFQYKKVLVLGATSGIGWALAVKFLENGSDVIVSGRRQEKLDQFVKEHGSKGNVDSAAFDITDLKAIPGFAADMFKKHPDIDCVWVNGGLQRNLNWVKPDEVSLDNIELELLTNYTSTLHLSKAFLPYLQKQAPKSTSLMFTSSGLALVPLMTCPNYCATKASRANAPRQSCRNQTLTHSHRQQCTT